MQIIARIGHAALSPEPVVQRAELKEGLSMLFEGHVTFLSQDGDLDLDAMLDTEATLVFDDVDNPSPRFFHAMVDEAAFTGMQGELFAYELTLRPRFDGLKHRVRSRIFQDLTAVQIVTKVMSQAGWDVDAVKSDLGQYPRREICIQYGESELAFLSRLMEDEGIFYWFDHSEDQHVLRLADDASAHQELLEGGPSTLRFVGMTSESLEEDTVRDLVYRTRITPGLVTLRDWNWQMPKSPVQGAAEGATFAALEQYRFPGGFLEGPDGQRRAQNDLHALRARQTTLEGRSPCRRLAPGRKFELTDTQPEELSREYLLLEVTHRFEDSEDQADRYQASFIAVLSETEFRPPRVTPRPFITGKELAHVTCPPGEEIHVDEMGRVKVHFYWDREGKMDDTSSCWLRVQQQNTTGSLILPRQGWEVEVGFLYGDPDRPVVLQKLYNKSTMPPYALPDNLHQSSLQSSSSPGGGGTNEVRMSDGAGGMEFFVHSQKDLEMGSANDMTEKITVNETVQIKTDFSFQVGTTEDVTVVGNQSTSVKGAVTRTTLSDHHVTTSIEQWDVTGLHGVIHDAARTEKIGGLQNVMANSVGETFNHNSKRTVGGVLSINALGPIADTVTGKKTEMVGGAKLEIIKGSKTEDVGKAKALTSGLVKIKTGKDIAVTTEGALGINASAITIEADGDFGITGKTVNINVGAATLDAGATIKLTPASAKLTGDSIGSSGTNIKLKGKVHFKAE